MVDEQGESSQEVIAKLQAAANIVSAPIPSEAKSKKLIDSEAGKSMVEDLLTAKSIAAKMPDQTAKPTSKIVVDKSVIDDLVDGDGEKKA